MLTFAMINFDILYARHCKVHYTMSENLFLFDDTDIEIYLARWVIC